MGDGEKEGLGRKVLERGVVLGSREGARTISISPPAGVGRMENIQHKQRNSPGQSIKNEPALFGMDSRKD